MIASILVATIGSGDQLFLQLREELDARRMSYTLVFVDTQFEPELTVFDHEGRSIERYDGEKIFAHLDDIQEEIEEHIRFEADLIAEKRTLLKKLNAIGRGEDDPVLTDDECQMLTRTRAIMDSEPVRRALRGWSEHFKSHIDGALALKRTDWSARPAELRESHALLDELINSAKSAIERRVDMGQPQTVR